MTDERRWTLFDEGDTTMAVSGPPLGLGESVQVIPASAAYPQQTEDGSDEEWRRLNYRLAAAKTDGLTLEHFQVETHELAVAKGFWDHDDGSHQVDSEKIALMHSELSEALDALRDGDLQKVELELADCFIRMLDYCEARDLSLLRGYRRVQEKAQSRPRLHGRKF